jgi:hypothetical protein
LSPQDFEENLRKLGAARHSVLREHQAKVTELLMGTNRVIQVRYRSSVYLPC